MYNEAAMFLVRELRRGRGDVTVLSQDKTEVSRVGGRRLLLHLADIIMYIKMIIDSMSGLTAAV